MANVLFINGPASGHVFPTLGLVEALIAEGEHVVYVSSEEFRQQLERIGASFASYDNFLRDEDPFQSNILLALVTNIVCSYDLIIPVVLELASESHFDYMIYDSMYGCGNALAEMLGIPHISVSTSLIGVEKHSGDHSQAVEGMKENLSYLRGFLSEAARIKQKYGIKRKMDVSNVFFNEGMLTLVFTSSLFQPDGERLNSRYRFIGPCLTERLPSGQVPIRSDSSKKTVYISMGTQFNDVKSFYETCFSALADFDGHVIVSVGSRIDLDTLDQVPTNVMVHRFVDQLKVLRQADLFITHGGMNSVSEALYYNVPLIVVPMAADQLVVGRRVHELGAGIMLNKQSLTADLLRDAAYTVLANASYPAQARKVGDSLHKAGGKQTALEEIRKFKALYVQPEGSKATRKSIQ